MRANIVTFIAAGHETTANALTWTLYLLSQAPEWRERVEAEIDAISIPATRPRFRGAAGAEAVIEEALRLYPPAAILSREAIGHDGCWPGRIPAGTVVTVAPFVLHRHRTLWEDPDAFDPARFLGAHREAIDRYAYIPFGAGPRVCIGMGFAMQMAMVSAISSARCGSNSPPAKSSRRAARDVAAGRRDEDARATALAGEDIHQLRISSRKSVDRKTTRAYIGALLRLGSL